MRSKNKPAPTMAEQAHIIRIKNMPCGLCRAAAPSDCHEIKQGQWFTSIPLCKDCHQGSRNGLHGQRFMWKLLKMEEIDVLGNTVQHLLEGQ